VTTRELEKDQDIDTLSKLPGVSGVVTLNRLLLPSQLASDLDLREAAAKLHTDAVIVYTVATDFSDSEVIAPLTTLTLGLAPNKHYKINSTASAILMDTKTGYIYGALEEGQSNEGLTMAWGGRDAIEAARKQAERKALEKLLQSFDPFWRRIYGKYRH
jgi:hypothetical protein